MSAPVASAGHELERRVDLGDRVELPVATACASVMSSLSERQPGWIFAPTSKVGVK